MNSMLLVAESQELAEPLFELSRVIEFCREAINDVPIAIEKPLAEVVWDISDLKPHRTSFVKLRGLMLVDERRCLAAEELKDLISLLSIDLHLVEHGELYTPPILAIGLNF